MTRKKFVKQMAARGINRNTAEKVAKIARDFKTPYTDALVAWDHVVARVREEITKFLTFATGGAGGGRHE